MSIAQAVNTHLVTTTSNNLNVYVNLTHSLAGTRISRQPTLLTILKEALSPLKLTAPEVYIEHDLGRVIGNSEIVETSEKDLIVYARRPKSTTYVRFVKNRQFMPTNYLTIVLHKMESGDYELVDTWPGHKAPPFPDEEKATAGSAAFWEDHAIILDGQPIQAGTLTKENPYTKA